MKIIYLIFINFMGMIIMYMDKRRSIRHKYRIRESTLFLITLIGGGIGTTLGMYIFRHKTRKWYFKLLPIITIFEYVMGVLL